MRLCRVYRVRLGRDRPRPVIPLAERQGQVLAAAGTTQWYPDRHPRVTLTRREARKLDLDPATNFDRLTFSTWFHPEHFEGAGAPAGDDLVGRLLMLASRLGGDGDPVDALLAAAQPYEPPADD